MTPQERKMIEELFDRLETLENAPRDDGAVAAINEGLQRAPNAMYPLVQTVLVQDEALKRADARIRELEEQLGVAPAQAPQQGSFLDSMRGALFGERTSQGASPSGSVPSVRPGVAAGGSSPWGAGAPRTADMPTRDMPTRDMPASGAPPAGGSFLGTAAATAAGVVGGALLMNSMRSLFGGSHGSPSAAFDSAQGSGMPWGQNASGSELARDAGLNDIGGAGSRSAAYDSESRHASLFDSSDDDTDDGDYDFDDSDFDSGDDSDFA
ncbi:MAG TPA: DUF2076 domain-containing protein [Xanthobacteraceae bacterium]|jgi:hypothetical protein|nr:DUF2076 domain-containing protein [Xanthobacteraceae bacterium]